MAAAHSLHLLTNNTKNNSNSSINSNSSTNSNSMEAGEKQCKMTYWLLPKTASTVASPLTQVVITAVVPTPAVEAIVPVIPLFHSTPGLPSPRVILYLHKSNRVCMGHWVVLA